MVKSAGWYYVEAFRGFWGVTQGGLLLPTIFNVVVDAVVCHWVSIVAGGVGGFYGWGMEVIHHATFFYANNGMVVSIYPEGLQGAFRTLTGIFD